MFDVEDPQHAEEVRHFTLGEADVVLARLVPLAGALNHAIAEDRHVLATARRSDIRELLRQYQVCPHKLAVLLVIAAGELHGRDWQPDDHADAAGVDPDFDGLLPDDQPPEVKW